MRKLIEFETKGAKKNKNYLENEAKMHYDKIDISRISWTKTRETGMETIPWLTDSSRVTPS